MATVKPPLLLSTMLENIEVEGEVINEKGKLRTQYYVDLYVDDIEAAKSTKLKSRGPVLKLKFEWTDRRIWFRPSSKIKIVLYRALRGTEILKHIVGQHEGTAIGLIENYASFDLTDRKGTQVPVHMKILLCRISGSVDNMSEFLGKVDADILRLPSNDASENTISVLGQILKLTKNIIDKVTQVHPMLNASWTVVSTVYQVVQETDIQDKSIRELASSLREMLGTANSIPDLPVIPNTTDVISDISRQSLQVASIIDEYTKLSWVGRTARVQMPIGLKSQITECQKSCTDLAERLFKRVHVDTNIQVHKSKKTLEALVKIILEKGTEVKAQGGGYGNALQAAASEGHKAVVKMLLEQGTEVEEPDVDFGIALQAAKVQDLDAVAKMLVEYYYEGGSEEDGEGELEEDGEGESEEDGEGESEEDGEGESEEDGEGESEEDEESEPEENGEGELEEDEESELEEDWEGESEED